jgi:hypothetical protein
MTIYNTKQDSMFVCFNYFRYLSYYILLLKNSFILILIDPLVDYPDFAIQRAVGLYKQLDKSKITPPDFVSYFFNNCEIYKLLDL